MAWNQFGCHEDPFGAGGDDRCVYLGPTQRDLLASLRRAVLDQRGVSLITGQAGTGKTSLLDRLVTDLQDMIPLVFHVATRPPTPEALLDGCCQQTGLTTANPAAGTDPLTACQTLLTGFEPDRHRVLILDEAQSFPDDMLGTLLALAAPQADGRRTVPIVLAGQLPLADRFLDGPLRAWSHLIGFRAQVHPLDSSEVEPFILHRLQAAGCTGDNPFTREAIDRIASYTDGFPARISTLCSLALFFAAEESATRVRGELVDMAASSVLLSGEPAAPPPSPAVPPSDPVAKTLPIRSPRTPRPRHSWRWSVAALVALAAIGGVAWTLLDDPRFASELIATTRHATWTGAPARIDRPMPSVDPTASAPDTAEDWTRTRAEPRIAASSPDSGNTATATADPDVSDLSGPMPAAGTRLRERDRQPPVGLDSKESQTSVAVAGEGTSIAFIPTASPPTTGTMPDTSPTQAGESPVMSPEIRHLLTAAAAHFEADRLMAPPFDNALATYRKVLRLDPDNQTAWAGLEAIRAKLRRFAQEEEARGDPVSARRQLQKLQLVDQATDAGPGLAVGLAGTGVP